MTGCAHSAGRTLGCEAAHQQKPASNTAVIRKRTFSSAGRFICVDSDISEFVNTPAINLSIGYHNQHRAGEKLHLDEMFLNISRVKEMIANPPLERYEEPAPRFAAGRGRNYQWGGFGEEKYDWGKEEKVTTDYFDLEDLKDEIFFNLTNGLDLVDYEEELSLNDVDAMYWIANEFQTAAEDGGEELWLDKFEAAWEMHLGYSFL